MLRSISGAGVEEGVEMEIPKSEREEAAGETYI